MGKKKREMKKKLNMLKRGIHIYIYVCVYYDLEINPL